MTSTYHVAGADGQVYGPVAFEELQAWIREGRLTAETLVFRADQAEWQPAASFAELGLRAAAAQSAPPAPTAVRVVPPAPATAAPVAPVVTPAQLQALAQQVKAGAGWFYWIAGLSVVNTAAALTGSSWGFVIGLGITRVFDAFGQQMGGAGKAVTLGLNALILVIIIGFGWLANQRRLWAFVVGMIVYGLDGLLFLLFQDWLALGFHVLALYFMFKGFQACRLYRQIAGSRAS